MIEWKQQRKRLPWKRIKERVVAVEATREAQVAAVHVSLNGDDSHEWVRSGNGIVNSHQCGSDTVDMNHPVPWFACTTIQWKSSMIHQDLCLVQPETECNTARLHGGYKRIMIQQVKLIVFTVVISLLKFLYTAQSAIIACSSTKL